MPEATEPFILFQPEFTVLGTCDLQKIAVLILFQPESVSFSPNENKTVYLISGREATLRNRRKQHLFA